ncbi:MAG: hypothetical protein HKN73_20405 [Gemmatimonadetes bacterium]|nr:hypothetical protein [Gemmatimonadota bacterium]
MNCAARGLTPTLATLAALSGSVGLSAQTAQDFDEGRAFLSDAPMFEAFYPETYERLEDLRDEGRLTDDAALLVVTRGNEALALLTMQMSYHHIAQGDLEGEPWMVSF